MGFYVQYIDIFECLWLRMLDLHLVDVMELCLMHCMHALKVQIEMPSYSSSLICLSLCCRRQRRAPYGPWRVLWRSFSTAAPPMTARERLVSIYLPLAFTQLSCPDLQSHPLCSYNLNRPPLVMSFSYHETFSFLFFQKMSWCTRSPFNYLNDAYSVFGKLSGEAC